MARVRHVRSANGLQYFLTDHLGSTVAVTNASGTLTSQQRYLPFGGVRTNVTSPNPQLPITDLGYTGQRALDPGMGGLMDYHARFYSPTLGRFIQPDTITPGGPQGLNRYSYVSNRPVNFNDPTGHMMWEGDGGGGKCDLKCLEKDNSEDKKDYSDWNSRKYGGCFKCHAAAANGQIALTNEQLADAHSNITTWQAIGYTPIVATVAIVGAPALGPSIYNAAGVSCLSSPVCVALTGMAGGAGAGSQNTPLLQSGGTNNPRTGPIISRLTNTSTSYFRYWNTELGNESGTWVTTLETNSGAVAEDLLSMPFTPNAISKVIVPEGFRVQESLASPLFGNGGLGHQVELLGSVDDAIVEFLGLLK